jgi:hypothetical protein
MCQHFLPRGQYTPECRKGLGQDVLRADEIGIALVMTLPLSRACGSGNSTQTTMAFSDNAQPWTRRAPGRESHVLSTRVLRVGMVIRSLG